MYLVASYFDLNWVTSGFLRLWGRKTGLFCDRELRNALRVVPELPIATKPTLRNPVSDFPHFAVFQNIQHELCPQFKGVNKSFAICQNVDLPLSVHVRLKQFFLFLCQQFAQRIAWFAPDRSIQNSFAYGIAQIIWITPIIQMTETIWFLLPLFCWRHCLWA